MKKVIIKKLSNLLQHSNSEAVGNNDKNLANTINDLEISFK